MSKDKGAKLSHCEKYRYLLWRTVSDAQEGKIVGYIGVNPSTADHEIDDQTVKKWKGFTSRVEGAYKFVAGNLFAYRSTDVNALKSVEDPIGAENDKWLIYMMDRCDILIPCWGDSGKLPKELLSRITQLEYLLKRSCKPVLCFGKTRNGSPKHPQMLGYDTELIPYFTEPNITLEQAEQLFKKRYPRWMATVFKSSSKTEIADWENLCRADWHVFYVEVKELEDHPYWTAVLTRVGYD